MSTFFLTEEQFAAAALGPLRRRARRSSLRRVGWLLPPAVAMALVVVQVVLGQYIGAGIFLALVVVYLLPALWGSRARRENVAARTKRLTSVLYRIGVDESSLELEYDQSLFRMSFDNLLITRRNPDFYVIHHELGPLVYVPVMALTGEEQRIMDRHVSKGSFFWSDKLRGGSRS